MSYIERLLSDSSGEPNMKLHGAAYCIFVLTIFGVLNLVLGTTVQPAIITAFSSVAIAGFGASLVDNYTQKKQ